MINLPGEVGIDTVLKHESLKGRTDVLHVGGIGGAVHRSVAHDDNPGSLGTVDTLKIFLQPLVLLVGRGVRHVADTAEGTAVGDEGLRLLGVSLITGDILGEGPLGALGVIGLTVQGDKVSKAVVEGVPEVTDTAGLLTWHAESVLVGSEVSVMGSVSYRTDKSDWWNH